MGNKCDIYTDHKSLKYVFTQSEIEHETKKMARVDQGLRAEHSLPPKQGKRRSRCTKPQALLQQPDGTVSHPEISNFRM
jgi:hypothetical protein